VEVQRALARIAEIHEHMAKGQMFRGYRSSAVAGTAAFALAAAGLQPWLVRTEVQFVLYWMLFALASLALVALEIGCHFFPRLSPAERRMTFKVTGQFVPCLLAGAVTTLLAFRGGYIPLLPGLWALLFSLGLFASRPYLPHGVGWVALSFLVAGGVLLWLAPGGESLRPWGMGLTFGLGQSANALVLYWNLERKDV
jgi:hypothetical protein